VKKIVRCSTSLLALAAMSCGSDGDMNDEARFCENTRHTTAPLTPSSSNVPFLDFDENANRSEIALTFDDGPDTEGYTARVLDALRSANVRATFFINTQNAVDVNTSSSAQALVRRMLSEGHHVGNHSVHHLDFNNTSTNVSAELSGVWTTLRNVAPAALNVRLWRAPYGNPWFGPQSRLDALSTTFARTGVHIGWNIDSLDWDCGTSSCVTNNVLREVDAGKSGLVLLHSINNQTATALPTLISGLKSRGKQFIFVEDLVVRKYGKPSRQLFTCTSSSDCVSGEVCNSSSRCAPRSTSDAGVDASDTGADTRDSAPADTATDSTVTDTSVSDTATGADSMADTSVSDTATDAPLVTSTRTCTSVTLEAGALGAGASNPCGATGALATDNNVVLEWLPRTPKTSAYATYTLPAGAVVQSMTVGVRFLGDDATEPLWYWYIRNQKTGVWTLLGNNSWAGNGVYTSHTFTVSSPADYVDSSGRIQVRFTTSTSTNSAELDRMTVTATYR
jgi:peptidoglycan/xylan/chitin deacetylase (PgdA/CDA1 family)